VFYGGGFLMCLWLNPFQHNFFGERFFAILINQKSVKAQKISVNAGIFAAKPVFFFKKGR
jgi:hypothetical protein